MIDLDRNAGAPLRAEALAAMQAVWADRTLGNPSSVHRPGQRARALLERARRTIAATLGATPAEVVFTSGGTEADALAILGLSRGLRALGRPCGVACTAIEHPAVTAATRRLADDGVAVHTLAVDAQGRLVPDAVAETLAAQPEIGVLSITAAHHELGNVPPLAAIASAVRARRPELLLHVDAVQAYGRLPLSRAALGADALSVSAHKLGGPVGIGALVVAREAPLAPLVIGGAQQHGRRGGTESVALAVGFAAAATAALATREHDQLRVRGLLERLRAIVQSAGGELLGDREHHVGNTALVRFDDCDAHTLMIALDLAGIVCSTGAACSSGTVEPSPVLRALGFDAAAARGALRFSLAPEHGEAELAQLAAVLPECLSRVRAAVHPAPRGTP